MSITLLVCWIITKIMPVIDSASFKNRVFVPLVSDIENDSSDGYLSNEMVVPILRKDISTEKVNNLRQHDGYTYDYSRCIQFNNRILCGYDKNKGTLLDDYTMIDVGNGCRARGNRIECGYDNPQYHNSLRRPAVKRDGNGEENVHDKDNENNTQHRNKHHHRVHHHHVIKQEERRQAPTRTAAITEPTTPFAILNRMKTDNLENKLLKSASSNVEMKAEETSIGCIKTRAKSEEITWTTNTTESPKTTTVVPTERKSTVISRRTRNKPKSTTRKASTLAVKVTRTLPINSELNDISDDETTILRLKPVIKQKRRRLTKLLSTLPPSKLFKKSKSNHKVVSRVSNIGDSKINDAVLRKSNDKSESTEKKVTTACVEHEDRVVCYDFKT
ncbi:hypothetical protein PYW08_005690 [Mythimna loreyi]|uniref:Uncharacterized protein n=1 Tax=Mythimna loreyi TaxID=667449 RepID=A0ACC2QJD3_9NEOP|nr:hypothetical protein PYW08_005690 [Mythimna loreyi]